MKPVSALVARAAVAGAILILSAACIASLASIEEAGAIDPRIYAKRLEALIVF